MIWVSDERNERNRYDEDACLVFLWAAIILGAIIFGLSLLIGFAWIFALVPLACVWALLSVMYTLLALVAPIIER